MAAKYSRQREAIKDFLRDRKDHPTAEVIYDWVRREHPNISLGTIYRNLTLLTNSGEISRINVGDGVDHFDPNTEPHVHFLCNHCGAVQDLELSSGRDFSALTPGVLAGFDGEIQGSVTYLYGKCKSCIDK